MKGCPDPSGWPQIYAQKGSTNWTEKIIDNKEEVVRSAGESWMGGSINAYNQNTFNIFI